MKFDSWHHQLLHLLWPNCCLHCGLSVQQCHLQFCDDCTKALPRLSLPSNGNILHLPKVARGLDKTRFDFLYSLSWYCQPWRQGITQWKFSQDLAWGDWLCHSLRQAILQDNPHQFFQADAVCFVPMHPSRKCQRGFNQAELLAQEVARSLNLPLLDLFNSISANRHQVGASRAQRRLHLKAQFSLQRQTTLPLRLWLVDDVLTTGATANQLCRLLKRAGVAQVGVFTLAITPAPGIEISE